MANSVLMAYAAADFLFVIMGAIMLGFSLVVQGIMFNTPEEGEDAVRLLLYQQFPLTAGIVNAVFVLVTFLITIPGIITPARGWVKIGGYLATFCGLFSLVIGLHIWIMTLRMKDTFEELWNRQEPEIQDLMQTRFECCGFINSTTPAFVTNDICTSPAAAALVRGCAGPISAFSNVFADNIFTAVFGMVGIDAIFILATACLLKDRVDRERFRHIDGKTFDEKANQGLGYI